MDSDRDIIERFKRLDPAARQRVLNKLPPADRRILEAAMRESEPQPVSWPIKALETVGKPFAGIEKHLIKPAAAYITAPFTPAIPGTEKMGRFERERAEYEAAEFPTLRTGLHYPQLLGGGEVTLGVKGALEQLPWMIPAAAPLRAIDLGAKAAGLAGVAAKAGKAAQVVGAVERAAALPLPRYVKKVVAEIKGVKPRAASVFLPDIPDPAMILADIEKRHPERLNIGRFKKSTPELQRIQDAHMVKADIESKAENVSEMAVSQLRKVADDSTKLLQVDDMGRVQSPWIKFKEGQDRGWGDIYRNPNKYTFLDEGFKNQVLEHRNTVLALEEAVTELAAKHGVNINKELLEEGEGHFSRFVLGRKIEGRTISKPVSTARLMGVATGAEKPRIFKTMQEGIDKGFIYATPEQVIEYRVQQIINRIAGLEAAKILKPLTKTPAERMNPEVRQHMADLLERYGTKKTVFVTGIKQKTGELPKFETLGKAGARPRLGIIGTIEVIQRAVRGERVPGAAVKSISGQFPNIAEGISSGLAVTPDDVIKTFRTFARDVKKMAISPDEVKDALATAYPSQPARVLRGLPRAEDKYIGDYLVEPNKISDVIASLRDDVTQLENELGLRSMPYHGRAPNAFPGIGYKELQARRKHILEFVEAAEKPKLYHYGTVRDMVAEMGETFKLSVDEQARLIEEFAFRVPAEQRTELLQSVLAQAKDLQKSIRAEIKAYAPIYREARQRAILAAYTQEAVTQKVITRIPALAGRIVEDVRDPVTNEITMTGRELAQTIEKKFGPERVNRALRVADQMARLGVTTVASLDWSWLVIQGWPTLGRDAMSWLSGKPSNVWAKSLIGMVRATKNPANLPRYIADNAEFIARHPDLRLEPSEFYSGMHLIEKGARQIPLVGKMAARATKETYGRMGAAFSTPAVMSRVEMAKSLELAATKRLKVLPTQLPVEVVREIDEVSNVLSGAVSLRQIGESAIARAVQSALLFAPRYLRAYMMLFRDIARGGMTGGEARRALAGMYGSMILGYVALSEALGQEPKLNPAPAKLGGDGGEFLTVKVGGVSLSVGGMPYSIPRLLGGLSAAIADKPENLISMDTSENPMLWFLTSRASPTVNLGREIVTGRDFMGNRIESADDWARVAMEKITPIMFQNFISGEKGALKTLPAEFLGMRTWPLSEWQELEIKQSQALVGTGKTWSELGYTEKRGIERANPELKAMREKLQVEWVNKRGNDFERAEAIVEDQLDVPFRQNMELLAQSYLAGNLSMADYSDKRGDFLSERFSPQNVLQGMKVILDSKNARELDEWRKEQWEKFPKEKAMAEYREIKKNPPLGDDGLPDWGAMYRAADEFLAKQPAETRDHILQHEYDWIEDLPEAAKMVEKRRLEMVNLLRPYWQVEEKLMARLPEKTQKFIADFERKAKQQPQPDTWRRLMLERFPQLKQLLARIDKTKRDIHQGMRLDPKVDQAVQKWY